MVSFVCVQCRYGAHGGCRGATWCDCQHKPPGTGKHMMSKGTILSLIAGGVSGTLVSLLNAPAYSVVLVILYILAMRACINLVIARRTVNELKKPSKNRPVKYIKLGYPYDMYESVYPATCNAGEQAEGLVSVDQYAHSAMRIGDVERDMVIGELAAHMAAGRITLTEFDDRCTKALAATTSPDLHQLLADLPCIPGMKRPWS